jgi:hypothetical protein
LDGKNGLAEFLVSQSKIIILFVPQETHENLAKSNLCKNRNRLA